MQYDKKRVQILIKTHDGSIYSYDKNPDNYVLNIGVDVMTVPAIWNDFTGLKTLVGTAITGRTFVAFDEGAGYTGYLRSVDTSVPVATGQSGPYTYVAIPGESVSCVYLKEIPFDSTVTR